MMRCSNFSPDPVVSAELVCNEGGSVSLDVVLYELQKGSSGKVACNLGHHLSGPLDDADDGRLFCSASSLVVVFAFVSVPGFTADVGFVCFYDALEPDSSLPGVHLGSDALLHIPGRRLCHFKVTCELTARNGLFSVQ